MLTRSRTTASLRRAAVRATLAPSVHNTQPWELRLRPGLLELYLDRSRHLPTLDPLGRQMTISIGCALMNARVSLAADGVVPDVTRWPDPGRHELVAVIRGDHERDNNEPVNSDAGYALGEDHRGADRREDDAILAALDSVIELRRTNRRRFAANEVPRAILAMLADAAQAEGAFLHIVDGCDQRSAVAALSRHADHIETMNPAYLAELRAWAPADPLRRDGVPTFAIPNNDCPSGDEVPIRAFAHHGVGRLPAETKSSKDQCLLVLGTADDTPRDWLRAGEAMERVLLEITQHGLACSPITQVTEVPSTRTRLVEALHLPGYPHVLLRVGLAAATPPTRRRRLVEVLVDDSRA